MKEQEANSIVSLSGDEICSWCDNTLGTGEACEVCIDSNATHTSVSPMGVSDAAQE